jgi:hypothetical protein
MVDINKLNYNIGEVVDRHQGIPAVVCAHGPSLNDHKESIVRLHNNKEIIRFSVNDWFDVFAKKPDYWAISNPEYQFVNWVGKFNYYDTFLLFSTTCRERSSNSFITKNLKCKNILFDQRHFKNHNCLDILKNFRSHYEENKNFNFIDYGNNSSIFTPAPNTPIGYFGFDPTGICCRNKMGTTIQEMLQQTSGYGKHYSTGDTVALHAIAFAIIMGCNPIYISGMDLDYSLGYASKMSFPMNMDHYNIWQEGQKNLINDLNILNDSAENRHIEIINLKKEAWYKVFKSGELE